MYNLSEMPRRKREGIVDILSSTGEGKLTSMRDSLHNEIEALERSAADLRAELEFVEEALAMSKRSARGADTNGTRVRREDVLRVIDEVGGIVTPASLKSAFAEMGIEISRQATHNHLARLVDDTALIALDGGQYKSVTTDDNESPGAGDIPF